MLTHIPLESLVGLSTIRASRSVPRFVAENDTKIDSNARITHTIQACNRWFLFTFSLLIAVISCYHCFFLGLQRVWSSSAPLLYLWLHFLLSLNVRISTLVSAAVFITPSCCLCLFNNCIGLAGLSIAYALQLTFVFNMLVRQSAEVETQLVSVERVVEYTQLPNEGPYNNEDTKYYFLLFLLHSSSHSLLCHYL